MLTKRRSFYIPGSPSAEVIFSAHASYEETDKAILLPRLLIWAILS